MSNVEKQQDWVGRSFESSARLDPGPANRLAATLDRPATFEVGQQLPNAWHWLYFHDMVLSSDLGDDGHPRPGVTMPPSLPPRRMWAAGEIEFIAPLVLGETVTRTSTIRTIVEKDGRTGPLVFVTVDHVLQVDDAVVLREEQAIVYREPAAPSAKLAPTAPDHAEFSYPWQLDNVALFRYSALTFNSHRIHYDADYARDVEGYPALVVHGPLLVTLLLDAAGRRGLDVADIRYRAVSPVYLPDSFTVNGRRDDHGVTLWAASTSGHLAMDATATIRQENQS